MEQNYHSILYLVFTYWFYYWSRDMWIIGPHSPQSCKI